MKTLILAVLLAGGLTLAVAQQETTSKFTNTLVEPSWRLNSIRMTASHRVYVADHQQQTAGSSKAARESTGHTVVVDVWSPSTGSGDGGDSPQRLSRRFAIAALQTTAVLQNTQHRIEQSIKMGFPLGGNWIQSDFDAINTSLNTASLSVTNDADEQALTKLLQQRDRLKTWTDWLINENRSLRLANYYISPSALDNDERFQSSVACTKTLSAMLASMNFADDRTCW